MGLILFAGVLLASAGLCLHAWRQFQCAYLTFEATHAWRADLRKPNAPGFRFQAQRSGIWTHGEGHCGPGILETVDLKEIEPGTK